jgi:hypothetical protein
LLFLGDMVANQLFDQFVQLGTGESLEIFSYFVPIDGPPISFVVFNHTEKKKQLKTVHMMLIKTNRTTRFSLMTLYFIDFFTKSRGCIVQSQARRNFITGTLSTSDSSCHSSVEIGLYFNSLGSETSVMSARWPMNSPIFFRFHLTGSSENRVVGKFLLIGKNENTFAKQPRASFFNRQFVAIQNSRQVGVRGSTTRFCHIFDNDPVFLRCESENDWN